MRLLLLGAVFAFSACNRVEPPTLTPRSIRVLAVGPTGVTLGLELDVYNPNSFPLVARSVDGKLQLGDHVAESQAHAELGSNLAPKASSIVSSTVNVGFASLVQLAPLALTGQPLSYTFDGSASIGSEKLNVSLPFTLKGSLTSAQLLQSTVQGLAQ
ncbi:MAG: LEA type 2 family protein [Polyangiaceae bacterium]